MMHESLQPQSDQNRSLALSRRSFLRLTMGSFTMLPVVAGGVLVGGTTAAYAEEGGADLEAQDDPTAAGTITVVAVRCDQVCVSVIDLTNGRGSARTIVGAKVKLTSYFNKKTVEGVTDGNGVAVLKIADLAEEKPKKEGKYTFQALVEMSADGYRIFKTGVAVINGGKGFEIGTEKLESGVPYPSRVSFDDWDVLYTMNSFAVYKDNDFAHEIIVEFEGLTSAPLSIRIMDNEDRVLASGTAMPTNGHVTATFRGRYLEEGGDKALPKDGSFLIQYSQNGMEYEVPISLRVCDINGRRDEDPKINDLMYKLQPLTSVTKLLEFNFPKSWPILGNMKIRLLPNITLPIQLTVDIFSGTYGMALNITSLLPFDGPGGNEEQPLINRLSNFYGWKTKNGEPDPNFGKMHPMSSPSEQVEKYNKTYETISEKLYGTKRDEATTLKEYLFGSKKDGDAKGKNIVSGSDWVKDSSFQLSLWLNGMAKWQESAQLYQVTGGIMATASLALSWTYPFLVFTVPCFFSIEVKIDVTYGLSANFTTPQLVPIDFSKWEYDYTAHAVSWVLSPGVTFSLGIGFKGIISVSGQIGLTLTATIGFSFKSVPDEPGIPRPAAGKNVRFRLGIALKVALVFQCFWVSIDLSYPLVNNPRLIDSWRGSNEDMQAQAEALMAEELMGLQDMSPLELLNDPRCQVTVIPEAALNELVEFEGSYDDSFLDIQAVSEGTEDNAGVEASGTRYSETLEVDAETGCQYWVTTLPQYNVDPFAEYYEKMVKEDAGLGQQSAEGDGQQPDQQSNAETEQPAVAEALAPNDDLEPMATTEATLEQQAYDGNTLEDMAFAAAVMGVESEQDGVAEEMDTPSVEQTTETQDVSEGSDQPEGAVSEADSELQPQAEAPAEPVVSHGDTYGNFVPTRSYLSAELTAMGLSAEAESSIKGIGSEGGLMPSRDITIAPDVASDPRAQVVDILDTPHVFRLGIARVNGKPRPRLICHQLDPSRPGIGSRVFDIPVQEGGPNIRRDELFDYDFDVFVEQVPDKQGNVVGGYVHILIITGYREQGDDTPISSLVTDHFFCYGLFSYTSTSFQLQTGLVRSAADCAGISKELQYHSFGSPQISPVMSNYREFVPGFNPMLIAFIDRTSNNKDDILNAREGVFDGTGVKVNLVLGFTYQMPISMRRSLAFFPASPLAETLGKLDDSSIYALVCTEMIYGSYSHHLMQFYGKDQAYTYIINIIPYGDTFRPVLHTIVAVSCPAEFKDAHLIPWRGGSFLAMINSESSSEYQEEMGEGAMDSCLYRVDINGLESESPSLKFMDLGLKGYGIKNFCVDASGTTLYWPAERDDAVVFDRDENGDLYDTGKTESYYVIKASDFWSSKGYIDDADGTFCKPYVFADVPHRMDTLTLPKRSYADYLEADLGMPQEVTFISSEILDPRAGKANVWATTVPVTRCLSIVSVTAVNNVVLPGRTVDIDVEVRNDGNEWMRHFDANICRKSDGAVLLQQSVFFDEDSLRESQWNQRKEDGTLDNNEYDYWLMPGCSALYRIQFPVPSDWTGEVEIVVRIAGMSGPENNYPLKAQGGDLAAMAEAVQPVEYVGDLGYEPYDRLVVEAGDYEVLAEDLNPAPITVKASQPGGSSGSGGSSGASGAAARSNTTGRSNSVLPATGDETTGRGLGMLGVAATAFGAGMAAYSRRRTEIEAEEARENE